MLKYNKSFFELIYNWNKIIVLVTYYYFRNNYIISNLFIIVGHFTRCTVLTEILFSSLVVLIK